MRLWIDINQLTFIFPFAETRSVDVNRPREYKLYLLVYIVVSLVAIYMYPVSVTKLLSRLHVSTCMGEYRTLLRTCIRLHVSGVNAALVYCTH